MIPRRKRMQALVPLASMGDIAFLLIIFFMLTATFMKDANISIEPPRSPDVDEVESLTISVTVDPSGVCRLQGVDIDPRTLKTAVEGMLANSKDRRVKVSIDRALPKQTYFPVIEALSRAGATPVLIGEQERL